MRRALALVALAGLTACQDYRFNPVGKCLLQPGQARVSVEDISTADILFVIDDSGSMDPIQTALAQNFGSFITQLVSTQAARVASGKEPIDFHVAVTSSSVFVANAGSCTGAPAACTTDPAADLSSACGAAGSACVGIRDRYYGIGPAGSPTCSPTGVSNPQDGDRYPSGSFLAAPGGPKVLHFNKSLGWATWGTASPDPALTALVAQFGQNVKTGVCGSPQEQHLEAGRLAVKKALRLDGLSQPSDVQPGEWPHPKSKLVVVWVGNEDDCSDDKDPATAVTYSGTPGNDMCTQNPARLIPVADYTAFFTGLGRPFSAAFIRPGDSGCNCTGGLSCTGYSAGTRFKGLRDGLLTAGIKVVDASVCGSFAGPLQQIADLVTPPDRLELPSAPASDAVTQLRLVGADGKTAHVCDGPDPAREWWFVDCAAANDPVTGRPPPLTSGTSRCILLRPASACEPGPGQTLQAEYLGRVPAGGCATATDCAAALGGVSGDWSCDGATASTPGTCLCARP